MEKIKQLILWLLAEINSWITIIGFYAKSIFVTAIPVYITWNLLMPGLLGIPKISYFQAIGILILSNLLFKNPAQSVNNTNYFVSGEIKKEDNKQQENV